jgi:DNA-directed RNA polymerase II subunit RPB11
MSLSNGPMANAPDRFLTWRWEDEDDEERLKLSYVPDTKRPNCGTFIMRKEDHTLGNLIRIQLLRDEQVRFAGYRIPHPLVFEAQLRIETMDSKHKPVDVFLTAIDDLKLEVETIEKAFEREVRDRDREWN